MDAVQRFARRHGLLVVEDAAQAHGARWESARAGSLGHVAAFSFYPSKNLGALGDGGAICTERRCDRRAQPRLRNLGQRRKGEHVEAGFNERLDGLQAAMLRIKLRGLDAGNAARRERAALYRRALPDACRPLDRGSARRVRVPPASRFASTTATRLRGAARSGRRRHRESTTGRRSTTSRRSPASGAAATERSGAPRTWRTRCAGARRSCRCRCSPSSRRRRSSGWPRQSREALEEATDDRLIGRTARQRRGPHPERRRRGPRATGGQTCCACWPRCPRSG